MIKSRLRVMYVAQAAGGVDCYIRMLLKYMDKEKYENILVCSQDFKNEDYNNLVEVFERIDMHREIGLNDFVLIVNMRKLIKKYNPDIVYAHSSKAGVITRIANIGIRNICLYNPHGWSFNMKCSTRKRWLYGMIERLCSTYCNKIVCISDSEKRSAVKRKICDVDKLHVIYNGIDIAKYKSSSNERITRSKLGIPENAYVVGMVGRISLQKSPDIFIKAACNIKKIIPNAFFIIVGSGEQEELIKKEAYESGLSDSLLITGWVTNPMKYILLFDIAMLLSRWEGFGLVLAEYMIAEKPIVATRVDAIPEIIVDRVNGLLVEIDDTEAVCKAVTELYMNNSLCKQLVEKGKEIVLEKFDVVRVSREHSILYEEIIGNIY